MVEITEVTPDIFVDSYMKLYEAVDEAIRFELDFVIKDTPMTNWKVWNAAWHKSGGKVHIRFLMPDRDNEFFFYTTKLLWGIIMKLKRISFNGKQYDPQIVRLTEGDDANYFAIELPKLHLDEDVLKIILPNKDN